MMFATTMGWAAVSGCGVRAAMGCAAVRCCGMGVRRGGSAVGRAVAACARRWATSTILRMKTAAALTSYVASASSAAEAMTAPAMVIAPTRPGAHTEEDAVIEISGPVKAAGCAAIR